MKAGRKLGRRCYVRYQTVTERERGTIVELRRCLHCEQEEVILLGVYICASDTEEEESFSVYLPRAYVGTYGLGIDNLGVSPLHDPGRRN